MTPNAIDYDYTVRVITFISIGCGVIAFLVSMAVEHRRERKKAVAANLAIAEPFGNLLIHIGRTTAAAAIPAAVTLVYSAFDVEILSHMLSIHYWIAIAGLTLFFTSLRILIK